MSEYIIKPVGDCALCIEFANEISVAVNRQVHAMDRAIAGSGIPGIVETVPAYRTLIVHYRPEVIRYSALREAILSQCSADSASVPGGNEVIELPILYGGEVDLEPDCPKYDGWDGRETAPDLETVLKHEGLTREEFIARHSKNLCYVYFQAFAISHSYVGNPEKLFTVPRRESPRSKIPRGSIGMWADQTVLNGYDLPCGWQVIGRTPLVLYDESRDPASLCYPGQWVKFVPIDQAEYARIRKEALAGTYQPVVYEREDL